MKRYLIGMVVFIIFIIPLPSHSYLGKAESINNKNLSAKSLIVRIKDNVEPVIRKSNAGVVLIGNTDFDVINEKFGIKEQRYLSPKKEALNERHPFNNVFIIAVPDGIDAYILAAEYASLKIVEYAEPEVLLELMDTPNDPLYSHQWGLHNVGQSFYHVLRHDGDFNDELVMDYGNEDADIDAQEAIDTPPDKSDTVVVAIIDTGLDMDHPDLIGHIWINSDEIPDNDLDDDRNGYIDDICGWDFSSIDTTIFSQEDNDPTDKDGHGTHCAGIVAAVSNNDEGVVGIVPKCKIMPLKIFAVALPSRAAKAIVYAADNGADIISMSFGSPYPTTILKEACEYAYSKGVILCAAAGNSGQEGIGLPAAISEVIAVGATNYLDEVTSFSSYGSQLDICAPGQSILSLRADTTDMYAEDNEPDVHIIEENYFLASGTSMSCPFAAGVYAYLRSVSPGIVPDKAREIIGLTADDILDPYGTGENLPGWDIYSGYGRVNLYNALQAAPALRARVSSPQSYQVVSGIVEISGTADGEDFSEYILEYGLGTLPDEWHQFEYSNTPIANGLLGAWDTESLNGLYTVRLRMTNTHSSSVTLYLTNSSEASISSPMPYDTVYSSFEIIGTAIDQKFAFYTIEYGAGKSPEEWVQIIKSNIPVVDGMLASWNFGSDLNGLFKIRLSVYSTEGIAATEEVLIYLKSIFSQGTNWKISLNTSQSDPSIVANYGDFDNDGYNDIVIGTCDGLKFYDTYGKIKTSGVPEIIDPVITPVAVGDLDGDGIDDCVAISDYGILYGFPSSEQPFTVYVHRRPYTSHFTSGIEHSSPILFLKDINGDNRDEIHYYPGYDLRVALFLMYYVYNSNGLLNLELSNPSTTDADFGYFFDYLPADLNCDGKDELYISGKKLYRFNLAGKITDSVDMEMYCSGSFLTVSMSAVDIDGDNYPELIMLAEVDGTHQIFAFDRELNIVHNWPHDTKIDIFYEPSDVVFCDINNDGTLEYFITFFDLDYGYVYAWNINGNPLMSLSEDGLFERTPNKGLIKSPVFGDVDGDGYSDVVAAVSANVMLTNEVERIVAWDREGQLLNKWPIIVEDSLLNPYFARRNVIAINDINQNGYIDLLMPTNENNLVFIDFLDNQYDPTIPQVPFWRYNRRLNNIAGVDRGFRIVSATPTLLQTNVKTNADITIGFSSDIDLTMLDKSKITVFGNCSGQHSVSLQIDVPAKRIILTPIVEYEEYEIVTVTVSKEIRSTLGESLSKDFSWHFSVRGPGLEVISTSPAANDVNVARDTDIAMTFNINIDETTLNELSIIVTGSTSGKHSGIVSYDAEFRTAIFMPDDCFDYEETITVELTPEIHSQTGVHMACSYIWTFQIISTIPDVVSYSPGRNEINVPVDSRVTVDFNTDIDEESLNLSTFKVIHENGDQYQGSLTYDPAERRAVFIPVFYFNGSEEVTVKLSTEIKSIKGIHMTENFTWSFVTMNNIISVEPRQNELQVSPNTNINVEFGSDIDATTLNNSSFIVYSKLRGRCSGIISYNSELRKAFFDPDNNFMPGDEISVILTDHIKPPYAEKLFDGYSWSFTVRSAHAQMEFRRIKIYTGNNAILLIKAADFDNDGNVDIAGIVDGTNSLIIYKYDGDSRFKKSFEMEMDIQTQSSIGEDFNGDGYIDIACLAEGSGYIDVLFNNTNGGFYKAGTCDCAAETIFSFDIDNDGDYDIASESSSGSAMNICSNIGNGEFEVQPYLDLKYDSDSYVVPTFTIAGDYNLDGDPDLAMAVTFPSDSIFIWQNRGNGIFTFDSQHKARTSSSGFPGKMISSDFDADGYLDIALAHRNGISIIYNNGDGTFSIFDEYEFNVWPPTLITVDIDGDGDKDIIVGDYYNGRLYRLSGNNQRDFELSYDKSLYLLPWTMISGDFDGDGDLDIAAGGKKYGITVLLNIKSTLVEEPGLVELPSDFYLDQNYPNPFNPTTTIIFGLPRTADVKLEIFNILGRKITTLIDKPLEAGYHTVRWNSTNADGRDVATGIYFYRLKAGDFVKTKKMLLLK